MSQVCKIANPTKTKQKKKHLEIRNVQDLHYEVALWPISFGLFACLLAWTLVLLAPCFFFSPFSWVLSFYEVGRGFHKK
jgi:hypothetical protein